MNIYIDEAKKMMKDGEKLTPDMIKSLNSAEEMFVGDERKPDPKWIAQTAILVSKIFSW